jgi:hypothetical protein
MSRNESPEAPDRNVPAAMSFLGRGTFRNSRRSRAVGREPLDRGAPAYPPLPGRTTCRPGARSKLFHRFERPAGIVCAVIGAPRTAPIRARLVTA